jgi:hypothetical protein
VKRRAPTEQISLFLGHLPKGSDATTSNYAPYDPDFCAEAVEAIERIMADVRGQLKRANIDQPTLDVAAAATVLGKDTSDHGDGSLTREEIRFLILSGVPHAEIVPGTSDGTVSLVRKELREAVPLYRNSESRAGVALACAENRVRKNGTSKNADFIGGPGRIRNYLQGFELA